MKAIEFRTDSATDHRWIDDALSGRARLWTKAHGEMLIRRCIDLIRQLADEMGLSLCATVSGPSADSQTMETLCVSTRGRRRDAG